MSIAKFDYKTKRVTKWVKGYQGQEYPKEYSRVIITCITCGEEVSDVVGHRLDHLEGMYE